MSKKASEDILADLHSAVAKTLLKQVREPEPSAVMMNAAIKFLKDNGIEADIAHNPDLGKLAKALPMFDEDGDEKGDYVN